MLDVVSLSALEASLHCRCHKVVSCVGTRTRLVTLGAAKLSARVLQVDGDSVGRKVEIDFDDVPVGAEAKKLSIMGVEIVHLHGI